MKRRVALGCAAAGLMVTAVARPTWAAAPYPTKSRQLFVAFAPGGAGDIVARVVSRKMTENTGKAVIIENRPSPVVAVVQVARAPADGYMMVMAGSGTALTSVLFKSLPYDLMKDFKHVSTLASFDLALITSNDSEIRTVSDVLSYAKANPGKMNIGTVRVGSTANLSAELLKAMAGADLTIVPYKATADVITAVRSGDVQLALEILPPILGQITAGNVRAIALTSTRRFAGLPDVPTVAESGVPGYEASSWNGISVPIATPDEVVAALNREINQAVSSSEVQKQLQAIGANAAASTPAQMALRMKEDMTKWKLAMDKAGIVQQ